MSPLVEKLLKRFKEYWKDKELAEKCGLERKDVCLHEPTWHYHARFTIEKVDGVAQDVMRFKCRKCGEFYR